MFNWHFRAVPNLRRLWYWQEFWIRLYLVIAWIKIQPNQQIHIESLLFAWQRDCCCPRIAGGVMYVVCVSIPLKSVRFLSSHRCKDFTIAWNLLQNVCGYLSLLLPLSSSSPLSPTSLLWHCSACIQGLIKVPFENPCSHWLLRNWSFSTIVGYIAFLLFSLWFCSLLF